MDKKDLLELESGRHESFGGRQIALSFGLQLSFFLVGKCSQMDILTKLFPDKVCASIRQS